MNNSFIRLCLIIALSLLLKDALAADTTSGTALPYESWLRTVQKSLTGPVAFSVALIGIVCCGATLIFAGGELGSFMRRVIYLVMVMTLLVGANTLMTSLFNGASVGISENLQSAPLVSEALIVDAVNPLNHDPLLSGQDNARALA
ncbi:MAG: TrbC/VirB2 family protein [Succinivibrio sp.]